MKTTKSERILALEVEVATLKAQMKALEGLVLGTPRAVPPMPIETLGPYVTCEESKMAQESDDLFIRRQLEMPAQSSQSMYQGSGTIKVTESLEPGSMYE